jgi:hypothetical protein
MYGSAHLSHSTFCKVRLLGKVAEGLALSAHLDHRQAFRMPTVDAEMHNG